LRGLWAAIAGGRAKEREAPAFCTILDLGTDQAKALVVELRGRESLVVGAGAARYEQHVSRQGGVPVDLQGMVQCCDRALRQAEDMTETCCEGQVVPDWVVLCVPGCATTARTHSASVQRSDPAKRVSEGELGEVLRRVQRLALRELAEKSGPRPMETGSELELLETAVCGMWIDGRSVTSPLGLPGTKLSAAVLNVVVPASYSGMVKQVIERLGLEILELASMWRALASAARQKDGVCVDVGGGSTDVVLLREGSAWATRSLPLGGSSFTAHLAGAFDLPWADAERLKLAYSSGQLEGRLQESVQAAVREVLREWAASLGETVRTMYGGHGVPRRFSICGGSSGLPELVEFVRAFPWSEPASGALRPEVAVLRPWEIPGVLDRTGALTGQEYVAPLAVAERSTRGRHPWSQWDGLLRQVKKPGAFTSRGGRS
jgi:cell division protein FtsA